MVNMKTTRGYKRKFVVTVTMSPGGGYEDCSPPSPKIMRDAIRRTIETGLSPSGYIAAKVNSIRNLRRR